MQHEQTSRKPTEMESLLNDIEKGCAVLNEDVSRIKRMRVSLFGDTPEVDASPIGKIQETSLSGRLREINERLLRIHSSANAELSQIEGFI